MKHLLWITCLVALWVTGIANGQTTWYVEDLNCNQGSGSGTEGDPFCLIQLGIDAAADGDEVVLAEGTYKETINLLGKAITVRSTDPNNPAIVADTVIDGFHLNTSVITCDSGEGVNTVINGLTITRGDPVNGGGMSNIGSSPTVINCTFDNNHATGGGAKGGGMSNVNGSNPTVINCTFSNNEADFLGGGMYNDNSSPTVTNCTFSDNDGSPGGGGMYNIASNPTVTGCTFSNNHATGGGGMHNESGSATVINCMFLGNSATSGGGINNHNSDTTVTNCTFIGNSSTSGGGMNINDGNTTVINCSFLGNSATSGGGISDNEGDASVTNCRFTGNTATSGGGMFTNNSSATVCNCSFSGNYAFSLGGAMYMGESTGGGPSPTVNNCNFWGNDAMYNGKGAGSFEIWLGGFADPAVSYSNIEGGFPGFANIDADPMFVSAPDPGPDGEWDGVDDDYGDLHIQAGSPAIDAADNSAVPKGIETDHGGNTRFIEDPNTPDTGFGDCPIVDMGSYEFQDGTPDCCPWDLDNSGSVGTGDLLALFAQWGTAGPADFDESGAVDTADLLILFANWGPCP